jgi:hypothetical protein
VRRRMCEAGRFGVFMLTVMLSLALTIVLKSSPASLVTKKKCSCSTGKTCSRRSKSNQGKHHSTSATNAHQMTQSLRSL